jgi:hypothetical protein
MYLTMAWALLFYLQHVHLIWVTNEERSDSHTSRNLGH